MTADPRLIRNLPWANLEFDLKRFVLPELLESLAVAFIPLWLVGRVVRNRTWGMLGMFVLTAAVAISIGSFLLLPDPFTGYGTRTGLAFRRIAMLFLFVPLIAFPYFLIAWTVQRRWRRIAWLLANTVMAAAIAAAFMLAIDARAKPALQHYSGHAAWTIIIPGIWLAGAAEYAMLIFHRPVRWLWRVLLRRFRPAV